MVEDASTPVVFFFGCADGSSCRYGNIKMKMVGKKKQTTRHWFARVSQLRFFRVQMIGFKTLIGPWEQVQMQHIQFAPVPPHEGGHKNHTVYVVFMAALVRHVARKSFPGNIYLSGGPLIGRVLPGQESVFFSKKNSLQPRPAWTPNGAYLPLTERFSLVFFQATSGARRITSVHGCAQSAMTFTRILHLDKTKKMPSSNSTTKP